MEEIESLLLSDESRIEKHAKDLDSSLIMANYASHNNGSKFGFNPRVSQHQSANYTNNNRGRHQNLLGKNNGGRFRNRNSNHSWTSIPNKP